MSQATHRLRLTESPSPLPGLPSGPLSAQQQLEALRRVQGQAEQRVQLGMQLFKAAEAHTEQKQNLADELREEQKHLREKVQEEVASSLRSYDQWVGRIDDGFTKAMNDLDQRLERLRSEWTDTQGRIEQMMKRSEALLEQNRLLQAPVEGRRRPRPNPNPAVSVAPPSPPRFAPVSEPPSRSPKSPDVDDPVDVVDPVKRVESVETQAIAPSTGDQESEKQTTDGTEPIYGELLRRLIDKSDGDGNEQSKE